MIIGRGGGWELLRKKVITYVNPLFIFLSLKKISSDKNEPPQFSFHRCETVLKILFNSEYKRKKVISML